MEDTEDIGERVRIGSCGSKDINIHGLVDGETELIEGAVNGHQWVTVKEGRIVAQPTYKPLPGPTEDEEMLPFWRARREGTSEMRQFLLDPDESLDHHSPSILISSVCGYDYTPENYRCETEKLERWGFICMRSRRDSDGHFWEFWYLPSLYLAKEELKDALQSKKDSAGEPTESIKMERALSFLSRNTSFGSLDVVVQRMAMVAE